MDAVDVVMLPRYVLAAAPLTEERRRELARQAGLADLPITDPTAMVPSDGYLKLWELVEHECGDPLLALRAAHTYYPGQLGLHDYLFTTAPTIGDGFRQLGRHIGALTTNFRFVPAEQTEQECSFDVVLLSGEGRSRELAIQSAVTRLFTRAQHATGRPVHPVRVGFRQRAPRRHDDFAELVGTRDVDFGTATDRVTFRNADLELPMRTADSALAEILAGYAASLPTRPVVTTWTARLHDVLVPMLGRESVGIDEVARRMHLSGRSLQRRLAEEGTTWREELARARRELHEGARRSTANTQQLASRLGYGDARSLRRAAARWAAADRDGPA
ncbi:AraC family transcriptional regulator ligand-binding domain-containing protein [Nocardia stercoris]|uniref:AraC family transcriptional regulator ligand-binding domain-containing protein n=1 Tax=Nocardia stercoris TaxID=2483361 RepID=UPI001319EC11|nr:AraC family transcriptional regulator ligand-binding domain-containing protein [Nocardia stercoris]